MNLGADFCLMPSMFEPGGIVQQEFFVAGTPVIAFKTGGLKDTVVEFDKVSKRGNGFTFEAHTPGDFMFAMQVRVCVWEFVQQHAWTPAAAQGPCSHAVPSHPSAVCAAPPSVQLPCTTTPCCTPSSAQTRTTPSWICQWSDSRGKFLVAPPCWLALVLHHIWL